MTFDEMKALPPEKQKEIIARLSEVRATGKSTNYACQYGSGAETLARTAKISLKLAKTLHKGYHELNWTLKKIAELMVVKKTKDGQMWQKNPINGFWYSLRTDKDRVSTLLQGTGAYVLDIWLFHANRLAKQRKLNFKLLGQFH